MAARRSLPQLDGGTYITDGGMETTLIFRDGLELPDFASFVLLDVEDGIAALRAYYAAYVAIAKRHGSASCSTRRPGVRITTGAPGSAIRRRRSTT